MTQTPMGNERVLIVDDDTELCDLLGRYLSGERFEVDAANDGEEGVRKALGGRYDIVVLDVMLPRSNGFDVLRRIRAESSVPVVMLTARGEDVDRIVGLELGADDYLPKPFNPRELVARIRAVLRRASVFAADDAQASPQTIALEDVELNKGTRSVRRDGRPVELTTVEFDLLEYFIKAAGRIVSREQLVKDVLGRDFSPFDRSIDTHVSNLRKKLGRRVDGLDRIKSVRGAGYIYVWPGSGQGG